MDLTHRFSVPADVHAAWNVFNDVVRLAPCFPGATITSVQGDEFNGKLKIKLGPATLVYNGSGRYVERDETEHRVLIEASGHDRRRNGTAAVTVAASFIPNGTQTDVEVLTNLAITGKPAQFGDEVISDVSVRLLEQFVDCMSRRFGEGLAEALSAESGMTPGEGVDQADMFAGLEQSGGTAEFDQADTEQTIELEAVPATAARPATSATASSTAPRTPEPQAAPEPQGRGGDSTLDVLRTIGPVVLRRYGPALAVFALLLFVVIKILRRKS